MYKFLFFIWHETNYIRYTLLTVRGNSKLYCISEWQNEIFFITISSINETYLKRNSIKNINTLIGFVITFG